MSSSVPESGSVTRQGEAVAAWSTLVDRTPTAATVHGVDLVIIRWDDEHSVLHGRCLHRGAHLADGSVQGDNLICGLHGWDYRLDTGISAYNNAEALPKFTSWVHDDTLYVDSSEVEQYAQQHPSPFGPDDFPNYYGDSHAEPAEPYVDQIRDFAINGLSQTGQHGPAAAMGVPRNELPRWESIQFVTGQLAKLPLLDNEPVGTDVVIGPNAKKPLHLKIPMFVSDMSFGALSEEAKTALAMGAELAGTGICSGEGGMLPEEQAANSRYFYELASGRFGWNLDVLNKVQAFHFKGGQGAKTGTGGHLPGSKVQGKIAQVRNLPEGQTAVSPSHFPDWNTLEDFKQFAKQVREHSGGIPIGFKLSAQHIEKDIDAALEIGVDYVILDGRGGGTGDAPLIFRDNISVPTIPALARARKHLDQLGRTDITLVATGGIRTPADMAKALALGADAVALANSAIQAIGCLGMRACNSNNCPVGIATQKPDLRARLPVKIAAERLARFMETSTSLMSVLARACGHNHLNKFTIDDLTTFDQDMAALTGIAYGGVRGA